MSRYINCAELDRILDLGECCDSCHEEWDGEYSDPGGPWFTASDGEEVEFSVCCHKAVALWEIKRKK